MNSDKIKESYLKIVGLPKPPDIPLEELAKRKFLVDEDIHKEVNIGQAAIGYLKSMLGSALTKVDNNRLKKLILPSWKHYNDFCINCMDVGLYLLETDFKNSSHASGELLKLSKDFDRRKLKEDLAGSMKGTYGLSFLAAGFFVILVDSENYKDGKKILHEFTHYVQEVTGKLILGDDIKDEVKKHFNLNDQYVRYILNEQEFWTNIYNDLFNFLQKNYWLHYNKQMNWEEYMNTVAHTIKIDKIDYESSFFFKQWKSDKCGLQIYDLIACIAYVKPEFFDEIVEKLKNRD